jgi:hypothetical protein
MIKVKEWTIDDLDENDLIELAEYIDFSKWRKNDVDSSNIKKILYNDESKELVIKFNSGETYTYEDIDFSTFRDVIEGNGVCRTDGENEFGSWYVGKSPSVGAAVYDMLVSSGASYRSGGSFR